MSKFDGQNSGFGCVTLPSCPVCCRHSSAETGNLVNYHLTGEFAERETTGHTLWFQRKTSWVNALFVCKFDSFPKSIWSSDRLKFPTLYPLACVASVSVGFGSKELQRENGASKRRGRGRGRKEGNACRQTPGFWKPPTRTMISFRHRLS